jgi:hypothetical protein
MVENVSVHWCGPRAQQQASGGGGQPALTVRPLGDDRPMRGTRERPVSRPQTLAATVAAAGIVQLPTAAIVVALTRIHAEFGTSLAELQWTVTAFMIPFSALLVAAGRIAEPARASRC